MVNLSKFMPNGHWLAQKLRRILYWEFFPIAILIAANLIIGLETNHYGVGWDDSISNVYGEASLSSYRTLILDHSGDYFCASLSSSLCYYGPGYLMFIVLITKFTLNINPALMVPDIWHAINFIVFNIGIISLYVLSRLWLSKWSSVTIAMLFAAQPLLRGHGFINPKDLPFMVFFLVSVTAGLAMVESWAKILAHQSKWDVNYRKLWGDIWRTLGLIDRRKRKIILGWSLVFVVSFFLALVFLPVLKSIVGAAVGFFYYAPPDTWAGTFFSRIAPNAGGIPVTNYIEKSIKILARGIAFHILFSTALMMGILAYWSKRPLSAILSAFANQLVKVFMTRQMWFAGLILGFTSAIRVLGPYSGVIVLVYMIFRLRQRALPLLLPYFIASFLFMYVFWPFLWKSPLVNFVESAAFMSAFPWYNEVLFNGVFYQANNLPATYLPVLITIQITESVIFLFLLGIIYLLVRLIQQDYLRLFLVFMIWFVVPITGAMIFRPTLYDNFRQFLFIVPPLFLVAGLGLDLIFKYLQKRIFRVLLLSMLIIPALYINIQLYPFEYVYYNAFVGGTSGAFRRYEMDYWRTAFREAVEYLNVSEVDGAQLIDLPVEMRAFAHEGLSLYKDQCSELPLYAVISSRWNEDKTAYETAPVVHAIERGGAVMAVIRKLPCPPIQP